MKTVKPRLFIGSSVEGLNVAYAIQKELEHDAEPTVWKQGIFKPISYTLPTLVKAINNTDFAIFVFTPDDLTIIRKTKSAVVRDNIIFEFGLFIGGLGKDRVFFVKPRSIQNLHLPTDLTGLTPGTYDDKRKDKNLNAALGPFCNDVRNTMSKFFNPAPSKRKLKAKAPKITIIKKDIKPKAINALTLFNGTWRNDYVINNQSQPPEFFEIKDRNKYCINGIPWFTIENIHIDYKNNVLTFEKIGIRDNRRLSNVLKIINEKMFVGFEADRIPITYTKVV